MKKCYLTICFTIAATLGASAWGGYEHTIIAYSAQDHLTDNAYRNIRKYLDQPIYEYAEWMDYTPIQACPEFGILKNGHCTAVDFDGYITETSPYSDGQCAGYPYMVEVLNTLRHHKELPDSLVALHLRCFIHMIGDMHCPGHIMLGNYPKDGSTMPGTSLGDYLQFKKKCWYGGAHRNFHWLWDTPLMNIHGDWTFEQWRQQLDTWSPEQQAAAAEGTIRDYLHESAEAAAKVYDLGQAEAEYDVSFYTAEIRELVFRQLRVSIYRMAKILNDCFDYDD